jgi:hypothetical protein
MSERSETNVSVDRPVRPMDDTVIKAAIHAVKTVYPNAFAERCANGGCVIRTSLQHGVVIGHASPGDHIAAWLDAAKRLSSQGSNAELSRPVERSGIGSA